VRIGRVGAVPCAGGCGQAKTAWAARSPGCRRSPLVRLGGRRLRGQANDHGGRHVGRLDELDRESIGWVARPEVRISPLASGISGPAVSQHRPGHARRSPSRHVAR
jgi:hypothetical protein